MAGVLVQWTFEPVPVAGCALAGLLYFAGRRAGAAGLRRRRHAAFFSTGLLALLLALISPLDAYGGRFQWVHMVQHVLLLVVAPPLILLGDPFGTAWRGLRSFWSGLPLTPPGQTVLRGVVRRGAFSGLVVAVFFIVDLLAWHVPALYDLTLRDQGVHDLEHTLFLAAGLLLWDQVIVPAGGRGAMSLWGKAITVVAATLASWALAILIGYATHPLYAYPGGSGLPALADQQIAAGVMWVPGSLPFVIALGCLCSSWFDSDERALSAASSASAEAK